MKRKAFNYLLKLALYISAAITFALLCFVVVYVFAKGLPHLSVEFLSTKPSYLNNTVGILPNLLNTLYIIIASVVFTLPIGVGAAIYLNEYAQNRKIVAVIEFATETLAGIPSIIYGLVGMLFFCRFLNLGTSLLAGALTLMIMNLPTVIRITQESLKTVDQSYRDGAFGLGAGKWRVIRTVVLPNALSGIITGCILSVGRIIGETAALLFTAGFAHSVGGFFEAMNSSGATLSVAMYVYAKEQGEMNIAFAIASILIMLTFVINICANFVSKKLNRR